MSDLSIRCSRWRSRSELQRVLDYDQLKHQKERPRSNVAVGAFLLLGKYWTAAPIVTNP